MKECWCWRELRGCSRTQSRRYSRWEISADCRYTLGGCCKISSDGTSYRTKERNGRRRIWRCRRSRRRKRRRIWREIRKSLRTCWGSWRGRWNCRRGGKLRSKHNRREPIGGWWNIRRRDRRQGKAMRRRSNSACRRRRRGIGESGRR